MINTEEFKSIWPISSVHSAPLLLNSPCHTNKVGPLFFNPSPEQHHHLLLTNLLSPRIPPRYPYLSFPRFLHTTTSSILPSTINSISDQLLSSLPEVQTETAEQLLAHNSLQLMKCPASTNSILAFFPTGPNSDQLRVAVLTVDNSQLIFTPQPLASTHNYHQRILKFSVNHLDDWDTSSGDAIGGYVMACTTNSVRYYNIRIKTEHSGKITPRFEFVGNNFFKSGEVVHACWSPHIPQESFVLLKNGNLFLFDLDSVSGQLISSPSRLNGKKYTVLRDDVSFFSKKLGWWVSCDFSYDPRLLIVVHFNEVFHVDLRLEKYKIIPLLKLDGTNDKFIAFSVVAHDRFHFTLASNHTLFLCDVRKPMVPVLRWTHNVANPSYVLVSSLSELRSQSEDATYSCASEAGYGILLGSFWNSEFSLFCYGPRLDVAKRSVGSSSYAWGLPSDLSLVTNQCRCGSCFMKEELFKDKVYKWIDWQLKKEIVLGFGILGNGISSQLLSKPDRFGGFTVITLTSSGNLESHRYCASWEYSKIGYPLEDFDNSFLYEMGEEEYKFKKVFQYLKLDWLYGYMESDLARKLSIYHDSESSNGSTNINVIFKEINLPMSIHEIALTSLSENISKRFGFSMYSDLPNALETMEDPSHLPPFVFRFPSSCSSERSQKRKLSDYIVGPIIPIPFLVTFHETRKLRAGDLEIDIECDEVIKVANEVTSSDYDNEDVSHNSQPFASYKPSISLRAGESVLEDEKHTNLIFKMGDSCCPLMVRFEETTTSNFAAREMKAYKLLRKQYSNFEKGFAIYQDFIVIVTSASKCACGNSYEITISAVCNHGFFMMAPNRWIPSTKTLVRPLRLPDHSITVSIAQPCPTFVSITVTDDVRPAIPFTHRQTILDQVKRMLRLSKEDDEQVKEFQKLHKDAAKCGFGRLFRNPSLFEDIIKTILLCGCRFKDSLEMAENLCEVQKRVRHKRKRGRRGGSWKEPCGNFPNPQELSGLVNDDLSPPMKRKLGYRAKLILDFAKCVTSGEINLSDLEMLRDGNELYKKMVSIRGFGDFVTCNALMCMSFYHNIPADSETVRLIKELHERKDCVRKNVKVVAKEIYDKYAPFQTLAYWLEMVGYYETRLGKLSMLNECDYKSVAGSVINSYTF